MKNSLIMIMITICLLVVAPAMLLAYPTVYPTGTTIYQPSKCWNGYTMLGQMREGRPNTTIAAPMIDMNGNVVHEWRGLYGFPAKPFPGGHVMGQMGRLYDNSQGIAMVQMDFDGNVVWKFDKWDQIKDDEGKTIWSVRQRHDFQREGNPVGYYAPGLTPLLDRGKTLILSHKGAGAGVGKWIVEVSWDGKILWQWWSEDHRNEVGGARVEMNTASWLGPNKWYDAGDERFHPENIVCDNHEDIIFIISRNTGKMVWKVGPDYSNIPHLKKLSVNNPKLLPAKPAGGNFVGGMLHNAHMIPKGLPGEGNILVFNNGMPYSLVMEFDPVTLKLVWEYSGIALGYAESHSLAHSFSSPAISGAQRLPNGNTLICEGDGGRIFEVTPELETVWEYIHPVNWYRNVEATKKASNSVYRAYRIPYDWVPQLKKPVEIPVTPPDNSVFRIKPGDASYYYAK